ncbi:hypothetical protein KHA80_22035 [Anaerobacillus sp. HL2]|nr:hypothetical protein KHA80_22035 [Anaerobacillus sp. HL2]
MESLGFRLFLFSCYTSCDVYKRSLAWTLLGFQLSAHLLSPSILGGVQTMLTYVVQALIDENNIKIVVFYAFSGTVCRND